MRDCGSSQGAAPAADVFNKNATEDGAQPISQWAADEVKHASGWKRNDQSDRLGRIALCQRDAR
jgi:hypothetical protein